VGDPTGAFDVFISGNLVISQTLVIGSPDYPALMRVYVGGPGPVSFSQTATIGGFLYAVPAEVEISTPFEIFGGVYAGDFDASGPVKIHYDLAVLNAGQTCPPPPPAATPCDSCSVCGNQACVNGACGTCSSESDCCRPLHCMGGTCVED
jgi:hypothetical protein